MIPSLLNLAQPWKWNETATRWNILVACLLGNHKLEFCEREWGRERWNRNPPKFLPRWMTTLIQMLPTKFKTKTKIMTPMTTPTPTSCRCTTETQKKYKMMTNLKLKINTKKKILISRFRLTDAQRVSNRSKRKDIHHSTSDSILILIGLGYSRTLMLQSLSRIVLKL